MKKILFALLFGLFAFSAYGQDMENQFAWWDDDVLYIGEDRNGLVVIVSYETIHTPDQNEYPALHFVINNKTDESMFVSPYNVWVYNESKTFGIDVFSDKEELLNKCYRAAVIWKIEPIYEAEEFIRDFYLKKNSVYPGDTVFGFVALDKKDWNKAMENMERHLYSTGDIDGLIFHIKIGNQVFKFPYNRWFYEKSHD